MSNKPQRAHHTVQGVAIADDVGLVPHWGDPQHVLLANGGSTDLAVNGGTPVLFTAGPTVRDGSTGEDVWHVFRLSVAFRFATNAPTWGKFGDIAALTNGVKIKIRGLDIAAEIRTLVGGPVSASSYESTVVGTTLLQAYYFDLVEIYGAAFRLDAGETVSVEIRDDLTGLTSGLAGCHYVTRRK